MYSDKLLTREIQEESIEAMKYFHSICEQYNIHYSVHAGTMLGAVREQGFIPWDDDIDLSMTREEYKKLKRVISSITLDKYYSFDITTECPRLCLCRPEKPLVWLSIFIYDYISEVYVLQRIKTYVIAYYYNLLQGHETVKSKTDNRLIKRMLLSSVRRIGGKISVERILRDYNNFCEYWLVGKKQYIQRTNDRYCDIGVKRIIPYEWMTEYQYVQFENINVEISKHWHNILVSSYGNEYMIPQKDNSKEELHSLLRKTLSKENTEQK